KLQYVVSNFINENPLNIEIQTIGLFKNSEQTVIKFNIFDESGNLNKLNELVRSEFPYQNDYPDYIPHMTLAYVDNEYNTDLIDGIQFSLSEFGLLTNKDNSLLIDDY